jgi:hypothetical protein
MTKALIALIGVVLLTVSGRPSGAEELVPRRVIAVFDGNEEQAPRFTRIHRYAELPLNYLGFEVTYLDLSRSDLPAELPPDVAGILTWFDAVPRDAEAFVGWLGSLGAEAAGQPLPKVVTFGAPAARLVGTRTSAEEAYLARLGLAVSGAEHRFGVWARLRVVNSEVIGLERDFTVAPALLPILAARAPEAQSMLRLASDPVGGVETDLVVVGKEGGFVHGSALLREDGLGFDRWILDPFAYFGRVLGTGPRPIPDPTTLSGRRIFFSTVNGEGWTTPAPADRLDDAPVLAGAIVIDEFLVPYPDLPVTLSLVTGELDPALGGGFAEPGAALARTAFTLPQVEAASRTRTLPIRWSFFETYRRADELAIIDQVARNATSATRGLVTEAVSTLGRAFAPSDAGAYFGSGGDAPRRYMLEPFDLGREIDGSLTEVRALLPDDRSDETPVLLWSGDAQPYEAALGAARAAGSAALGGGGGTFDATAPTISNLAPFGAPVGAERQIYAPLSSDAAFTNFWTTPAHGFRRLEATLEATETPRRLKPFHLSYAAFSALDYGLRNAVRTHLDAARAAPVTPIATSTYVAMARSFGDVRITDLGDGRWRIAGRGALGTVRFDDSEGLGLDAPRSEGVLGARREGDRLYVALDGAVAEPIVALAPAAPGGGVGAPAAGSERGRFLLDNARWTFSELTTAACSLSVTASGYGPGEMSWRVPAPGQYRVEVYEASSDTPVYWEGVPVADDRALTAILPATGPRPVRVTISSC